ncbi:MAG: ATP-binding cassette domain-containing protein [Opitutaceae bacterium]
MSLIRLGRRVLDRIDLQIAPREIVSLAGPADSGAIAVLECLLGLHPNASGGMSIEGFNPAFDPGIALSYISFVPSELHFPSDVTGLTHAKGYCRRLGRNIPENALRDLLELGGLGREWHGRPIGHYPPSLRRKLALSLAILEDRPLLLLDEPTTDLNASEVAALALAVRRLRRRGAAILIATGDLAFARRVSTRILHLENGTVLETTEVTMSRSAHRETSYLAQLV